jgi:23S rRNA (uracil1939-C5)-methyltransferase
MSSDEIELEIVAVANGGDGIGRELDGRVVFVPRTTTGDRVLARVRQRKAKYARALPVKILRASVARIDAPCRHFVTCGGCQLQHVTYEEQLKLKRTIVSDALARLGDTDIEVLEVRPAVRPLGYRNRIMPAIERSPTGAVVGGYHRYDAPGTVHDIDDCPLAEEPVREAWRALRGAWGSGGRNLPGRGPLRVTIRATDRGEIGILVAGTTGTRSGDPETIAAAIPGLASYGWKDESGQFRRLAGEETLTETWQGVQFRLRMDTFVQVNREQSMRMDEFVDGLAGPPGGRRVLDLYAGVGARAIRWAAGGAEVTACEVDPMAVEAGREAAEAFGSQVEFTVDTVESALPDLPAADLILVNPPRRGLSSLAAEALAGRTAERLIYVSCDPATLARDVARLRPSWKLVGVQPFDAFPQTSHVETIAWFDAARTNGAQG